MKRIDITRRAARNLRQSKGRTLLTSLAIAVGAFTIMMSLAAGAGTREYADKLISSNINPRSVMTAKDKKIGSGFSGGAASSLNEYSEGDTQFGGMKYETLSQNDIKKIEGLDGVEKVIPTYLVSIKYFQLDVVKDKKYTADVTTYDSTILSSTAAGTLPALGSQLADDEAVIPEAYADTIGKKPSELIGTSLTLHLLKTTKTPTDDELVADMLSGGQAAASKLFAPETRDVQVKIRAVSAKSATSFSASGALFISANKAQELSDYLTKGTDNYQRYISAVALVKNGIDPETVKTKLTKMDLVAMTAKDIQGLMFTMVNTLQAIVIGFGVLALIASIFGIVNTQYISVLERTSQIGLMKALGMPNRGVGMLFRYEAAWIGFLGSVIGIGIAWVAVYFLNPWIVKTLGLGEGNYLLKFEWSSAALLVLGLILVAIIAGWFPSRKAAKLDPIEALRTE